MDCGEVAEQYNAPLPPQSIKIFHGGLTVHMFQYDNYTLIPPAPATVSYKVAQMDFRPPAYHGFLGAWYRIGVASAINKPPVIIHTF